MEKKMRGVKLVEDPETGELIAVADTNTATEEENEEKFDKYGRLKNPNYVEGESERQSSSKSNEYILPSGDNHKPAKKVSLELGEEQYVDSNLQKIKELGKDSFAHRLAQRLSQ